MASVPKVGAVGGLFGKIIPGLTFAGAAYQAANGIARGQPVRGLVSGGLSTLGGIIQLGGIGGTAATGGVAAPVGIPTAALGMGISAASDIAGNEAQYWVDQMMGKHKASTVKINTTSNKTLVDPLEGAIGGDAARFVRGLGNVFGNKPARPYPFKTRQIGSIPPSANGESYRRAELRLADAARPGGGGGGGGNAGYSVPPLNNGGSNVGGNNSAASERSYQLEKSRIAQLAAQDTLNKKYNIAELTKQYKAAQASKDNDAATKIGMQIWAQTHSTLAGNVQPGQSGYEAIGMTPGMQRPSYTATNYFNPPAAGVADELESTPGVGIAPIPNSFSTQPLDLNKLLGGYQSGFDPSKMNYDMSAGEKFSIPGVSPEDFYKISLNLQTPEARAQQLKDEVLAMQMYKRGL